MSYNCICEEGSKLPSSPTEIQLLLAQIKREVEELTKTTEAKLLCHDGKIAELCMYVKDNLSSTVRCLLDSMQQSGELDHIITDAILNEITILNKKYEYEIDPELMLAMGDSNKLQMAIEQALKFIQNNQKCVIKLNRVYDITGYSLTINKAVNREKLMIEGSKGGIRKLDSGYMFVKGDTDFITDFELKDIHLIGTTGTKLFSSPDFINVTINHCKLDTIDTICDSKTYMQNIRLVNSLVTGGNGNLFDGPAFYGLFINGNTIESRKGGYVVNQHIIPDNMFDSCYFINIIDNLIEGFNAGGIVRLENIHKVNISNNYFEDMKNNIVLETTSNVGSLSVNDNRLFMGSTEMSTYGKTGLINIKTNKYPIIHAQSNRVENCYLVNVTNGYSVTNKIYLTANSITNNNVNSDYTVNGENKNHEINLFPLTAITGSINKYDRTINVISDKSYTQKLTIEEGDVRLTVKNGEINSSVSVDKLVGITTNNYNIYFGIPVFSDDLTDVQIFSQTVHVSNKFRNGSGNDKNLLLVATTTKSSSETATFIVNLKIGSGVRG